MPAVAGRELKEEKCPFCESFSTKHFTQLENHFMSEHKKTLREAWDELHGGPVGCACGCGMITNWQGWRKGYVKLIKGHKASLAKIHGHERAEEIKAKKNKKLRGRTSWAKGLTKESDERIAARGEATSKGRKKAFAEGSLSIWSSGQTKETNESLMKLSEDRKEKIASGEIKIWSTGLTKETDERLSEMSSKISMTLQQEDLRKRLDAQKRLSEDEIRHRIEVSGNLSVIAGLESYTSDKHKVLTVMCKNCGEQFISSLRTLQWGKCIKCSPGGSRAQEELAKFIEFVTGRTVTRNDRTILSPLEIDIYDAISATAIEYNGLYWHCVLNKSKNYHQFKSKKCADSGIKLMHVYEDEWREKRNIIESMIRHRLGLVSRKINARSCNVRDVDSNTRKQFFESNHIDGDARASKAFGLFLGEELVQCLSLRDPIHKSPGTVEICRSASLTDTLVRGGVSLLIKHAEMWSQSAGYNKMITYVDTRFGGTGSCYAASGMSLVKETVPRFWWTDNENRFDRFKIRADSKNGITEVMAAELAGVVKIWGCSNLVYSKQLVLNQK